MCNINLSVLYNLQSSQDLIKAGQDENEFTQQKTFDVKSKNLPFSIYVDDQPTLPEIVQAAASASCNEIDDIENRVPSLSEAVVRLPNLMRTAGTSTQVFHEHEGSLILNVEMCPLHFNCNHCFNNFNSCQFISISVHHLAYPWTWSWNYVLEVNYSTT